MVGHTSFYAKMVLANLFFSYENRTPGSEPTKGGLFIGNIVEVHFGKELNPFEPLRLELEVNYQNGRENSGTC